MALNIDETVESIYRSCLNNLAVVAGAWPSTNDAAEHYAVAADTYLMILERINALALAIEGDEDEEDFVGACSDDFICDECAEAEEEDRFYGTLNAIIDDYTASSAPRNFPNPSILNDMPPVFICGFGFSEN